MSDNMIHSSTPILKCEHVTGQYRGIFGVIQPVNDVSLTVNSGDIVGIVGESGCGKSTLGELITGSPRDILYFVSGKINVLGYSIYESDPETIRLEVKAKIMSFVPQSSLEALNPVKRIRDFIFDVIRQRTGEKGDRATTISTAQDHFERLGLDRNVINLYPHELSGGMKQRVVVAISTLFNPKLLIVDEPTSALDVTSQKALIQMFIEMYQEKIIESIIFISHDIATIRQICTRIVVMYAGEIVEEGPLDELLKTPAHPYTKALISSFIAFHPGKQVEKLKSIPGQPPDLSNPLIGCRFNPRCPQVMDKCKSENPPTFSHVIGRSVKCWLYE